MKNIPTGFLLASDIIYTYKGLFLSNGSIMNLLKPFIIEPTIFVSENVKNDNIDIFNKAINEQIDIFCCFYSMAFKVLNEISGTDAGVYLRKLSTTTNTRSFEKITQIKNAFSQFSTESYDGNEQGVMAFNSAETLSAAFESNTRDIFSSKVITESVGYTTTTRFFELRTKRKFSTQTNKKDENGEPISEITVKDLVIPIAVRAHIITANPDDFLDLLDTRSDKNSLKQRFWKWRSGGISFKEFILCTDLIREYREKKINNKDKIFSILHNKSKSSIMNGLLNDGERGYEHFFNLYLISNSDAEKIEKTLRGSFGTPNFTQKILTKLQAMELMVVDTEYNMGQMFLHNMPEPSIFSLDKLGKRKENTDLGDLLKSLYSNKPPMF